MSVTAPYELRDAPKSFCMGNLAVHEYQRLDLAVLAVIAEQHLSDFTQFTGALIRLE